MMTNQLNGEANRRHAEENNKHSISTKKRSKGLISFIVVLCLVLLGGATAGGLYFAGFFGNNSSDYSGEGHGEVLFTINNGEYGDAIANNLVKAGVTKSFDAFYQLLLETSPEPVFTAGVYRLKQEMSAQAALDALLDPNNRVELKVTIPEGSTEERVLQLLATDLQIPMAELEKATSVPSEYGLPSEATTFEGFLFPATYTFSPGITASEVISTLVGETFAALEAAGVPAEEQWDVIRLASVIQREAGPNPEDMYKISRVFHNRLDQGMVMGSDVTTCYGAKLVGADCINITQAALDDETNLYNTRVLPGLPIGPISNPGATAIDAAYNPADGTWMYFVTINLSTGETVFSETYEQHQQAAAQFEQWRKENPDAY